MYGYTVYKYSGYSTSKTLKTVWEPIHSHCNAHINSNGTGTKVECAAGRSLKAWIVGAVAEVGQRRALGEAWGCHSNCTSSEATSARAAWTLRAACANAQRSARQMVHSKQKQAAHAHASAASASACACAAAAACACACELSWITLHTTHNRCRCTDATGRRPRSTQNVPFTYMICAGCCAGMQ